MKNRELTLPEEIQFRIVNAELLGWTIEFVNGQFIVISPGGRKYSWDSPDDKVIVSLLNDSGVPPCNLTTIAEAEKKLCEKYNLECGHELIIGDNSELYEGCYDICKVYYELKKPRKFLLETDHPDERTSRCRGVLAAYEAVKPLEDAEEEE